MQKIGLTFKQTGLFILLSVFTFMAESLLAQPHQHAEIHPVLSAIQQEVQSGQISKDEALLQSIYAGYAPERLSSRFRTESEKNPPIRCMTPILMEYENAKNNLNAATISEIESLIASSSSAATQSHRSPSGNFILYYEVEGRDAVPLDDSDGNGTPDYIEKAAFAADSSYSYEVETIGFMDFLQSDPYEIYFQDFGFYGTTRSSGSTTKINIHSNFEGFPENTHPEGQQIGALYATMAHEIKHAIQYATNRWKGEAGNAAWSEMDAVMMEEVVFDDVNDYYNYIMQYDNDQEDWDQEKTNSSSIFGNPAKGIPGSYNHATWMLYFAETYGINFWVDVWEVIRADYLNTDTIENLIPFLDAVHQVLEVHNTSFPQEHLTNHVWHMTAGPHFSTSGFGFEEREEYPASDKHYTFYQTPESTPDSLADQFIQKLAANYIQVVPSQLIPGQPTFSLNSSVKGIGLGVVAFFKNGEIDFQLRIDPKSKIQSLQTTWSWNEIDDLRLAVVNTNADSSGTYSLTISSIVPDKDAIIQNYPNPFQQYTQIRFSLTEPKNVKIEVFDRVGRKVKTIVDEYMDGGFHTKQFNGSGLASGIYFYRIVTDNTVETKKMVLIK